MAQLKDYLVAACIFSIWGLSACNAGFRSQDKIITIEGVNWACNVSTNYALFGSTVESEEKWEVHFPVSEGDLIYMLGKDEQEFYLRYGEKYGDHLRISMDALQPGILFLNGHISQVEISDPVSFQHIISSLSDPLERTLSTLYIRDTLTDQMISDLQEHELSLRGTGIIFEHELGPDQFNSLLSFCRPEWLGLEGFPNPVESSPEMFFEDLKLLWITGDVGHLSRKVQCCKNLEALIISDWEPKTGELLPLSSLKNLNGLTLAECEIPSLDHIDFPASLKHLFLLSCDTVSDINRLEKIPELRSLSFAGSTLSGSFHPIKNLKQLSSLSFPANITQQDLNSLTGQLPNLESLELLECNQINDLQSLQQLKNLRHLILAQDQPLPKNLDSLDQLEFFLLKSELFEENPALIALLRQQLPHTTIVPGSGLCLGSGWILVLIPLVLISRFLFARKSKLPNTEG